MIADLQRLWQEAFGDSNATVEAFFATGFSPDRHHCIVENGIPVSALYWFDCQLDGQKLAYIYAVATLKSHRGKGLAHKLMEQTHEILKNKGYAGAILVPANGLFPFYEQLGYRTATTIDKFTCQATKAPAPLREISVQEYARLRKALLPAGGVIQDGVTLNYLNTYCNLYAGENFVLAAAADGQVLLVQEFLGDTALAGQILSALGMAKGHFRAPGTDRNFAMYLPLTPNCPQPGYFGLALD